MLNPLSSSHGSTNPSYPQKVRQHNVHHLPLSIKKPFHITTRQFGQRLAANHLENSTICGQDAFESVTYWIHLLSLLISGEGYNLKLSISSLHLKHLRSILSEYQKTLLRYDKLDINNREETNKEAQNTLDEIKKALKGKKSIAYTPLGYRAGPNNEGHCIPLKLRWYGDKIELIFLNLGEGAQMHPLLRWTETHATYHFQSFPVHMDSEQLFGDDGKNLFARLILLQCLSPSGNEAPYEAYDCYAPFWELGSVQSTFDSNLTDREEPPQAAPICADMATVLIIKDVLIDLGYKRKEIERFFLNEQLCASICFKAKLEKYGSKYRDWCLLRKGLEDFSISLLQSSALDHEELKNLDTIIKELIVITEKNQERLKPKEQTLSSFYSEKLQLDTSSFSVSSQSSSVSFTTQSDYFLNIDKPLKPHADVFLKTLNQWYKDLEALLAKDKNKASAFVYNALLTLPVPKHNINDYWDQVSQEEIEPCIDKLFDFVSRGLLWEKKRSPHTNIIALYMGYAIVDKLARRLPKMKLEGFASPFFPSKIKKENQTRIEATFFSPSYKEKKMYHYFEFLMLPNGLAHTHWGAIRDYFEIQSIQFNQSLFALHKNFDGIINLTQGVRVLKNGFVNSKLNTPVSEHLSYLKQFFPEDFRSGSDKELVKQFREMWIDEKGVYLPPAYKKLYSFAFYSWASITTNLTYFPMKTISIERSLSSRKNSVDDVLCLTSFRKPWAGCVLGPDSSPLESFSVYFENMKETTRENGAVIFEKYLNSFDNKDSCHWRRILATDEMRISSTIQWLRSNIIKLGDEKYRRRIEQALFEQNHLPQKIAMEPAILKQLRDIAQEGIDYFEGKDLISFLSCIRLATMLETFAREPDLDILKDLEQKLLSSLKECDSPLKVYCYLLLLYRLALPNGEKSAEMFLKARFFLTYFYKKTVLIPKWVLIESAYFFNPHEKEIEKYFENPDWVQRVGPAIIDSLGLKTSKNWAARIKKYPYIRYGAYVLNVQSFNIQKNQQNLVVITKNSSEDYPYEAQTNQIAWCRKGELLSIDDKWALKQIEEFEHDYTVWKKMTVDGTVQWYKEGKLETTLSEISLFNGTVWESVDKNRCYFIENKCLMEPRGESHWIIYQLKNGRRTGRVLAQSKQGFPFSLLDPKKKVNEVLCWINPDTSHIEEIEFPRANLSFAWKNEGYRCLQYPEYFISEKQGLEELNYYKGSLVLTNGTKKCVIIPAKKLTNFTLDFSPKVYPLKYLDPRKPYFFFTVEEHTGYLESDDPTANLYLTLLFAKQGDYKKGLYYLKQAYAFENYHSPFNSEIHQKLIEAFYNLKDESPEALAFYLRVGLFFIENATQLIQKHFNTSLTPHLIETFLWIRKRYIQYLSVLSNHRISPVPQYCRLSAKEELFLLQSLKPICQRKDIQSKEKKGGRFFQTSYWSPICSNRMELLMHGGTWEKSLPRQTYPAQLHEYSILPMLDLTALEAETPLWFETNELNKAFVRINQHNAINHFSVFYKRAQKGKASLDILYILRSAQSNSSMLALTALLHYVNNNPSHFSDLNFESDFSENVRVYREIVERVIQAQKTIISLSKRIIFKGLKTITFNHSHTSLLRLPTPHQLKPMQWKFHRNVDVRLQKYYHSTYFHFMENFFDAKRVAILPQSSSFALNSFQPTSNTEKEIVASLEKGFQKLIDPYFGKFSYSLKDNITLEQCQQKAREWLIEKKQMRTKLKDIIEKRANSYPPNLFRMGMQKRGQDLPHITVEGILTDAYSYKDPMRIRRANPSLAPSTVQLLIEYTIQYHILCIHIQQLENALKAKNVQAFAEALATTPSLSPIDEPEIYLYQSCSGKVLWPKQAKLLKWYYRTSEDHKTSLIAAPAGFGKTTVFQPIAIKRLLRKNLFPVSSSPRSLYAVDREGVRYISQKVFDLTVVVLELALSTYATAIDFNWLYKKLSSYKDTNGLKITPEVYFALLLKWELALESEHVESVRWISLCLDLIEKKGAGLFDESRLIGPFTQAEIGIGKPKPLPEIDRKVFIEIYRILVTGTVKDRVRLQKNLQATMDEKDYPIVRKEVCQALLKAKCFNIPPIQKNAIYKYWMGKTSEPTWLLNRFNTDQGRAIKLVKTYFDKFFIPAMNCVGKMQHVKDIFGKDIHVPARKRQVTRANFREVYATLITTIHGTLQNGLTDSQAITFLRELFSLHISEVGSSDQTSKIDQKLRKWLQDDSVRIEDFISVGTKHFFREELGHHPEALLFFLETCILSQVVYTPEQLVVSPIHFINAFKTTTLFSADPGPPEIYGLHNSPEAIHSDFPFLAQVTQQLAAEQNREVLIFPTFDRPLELFQWLFTHKKEIFEDMRMLADIGGTMRDFSSEEIARDFFQFLKEKEEIHFDGVIFFEDSSTKEEISEQLIWLKGWKKPKVLKGNDVVQALAMHGLKWDSLKLLTLIDPSHGTGANVKQPPHARGFLLLGEDLSLGDLIQGVMRLRGFLKEQVITWGATEALAKQIRQAVSKEIDPLTCLMWSVQNEAKRMDKEILLSAYQQITYKIEQEARKELKRQLHYPEEQIAIWKKHRKGFVSTNKWDPIERFKTKEREEPTCDVLDRFAEELHNRFAYSSPFKPESIASIVRSAEQKRDMLPCTDSLELTKQTHIYTYQKQEVEQQRVQYSHTDITPIEQIPLPHWLTIDQNNFFSYLTRYAQKNSELFGSEHLTANVWYSNNLLHTAQTGKEKLGTKFLKPAQYILLVEEKGEYFACALSDYEASFFQKQLVEKTKGMRRVVLLHYDGSIVQNGKGDFAFKESPEKIPFVQDCVLDIGLTRCELIHPQRFMERIEQWSDFWPMWWKIKKGHVFSEDLYLKPIERLVPAHLKVRKPPKTKPKSKGFFASFFNF